MKQKARSSILTLVGVLVGVDVGVFSQERVQRQLIKFSQSLRAFSISSKRDSEIVFLTMVGVVDGVLVGVLVGVYMGANQKEM